MLGYFIKQVCMYLLFLKSASGYGKERKRRQNCLMGNRYAMDRGYPKSVEKWVFKAILAIALQFGNSSNNAKKIG